MKPYPALLALALVAGCASAPEPEQDALPFHVALVPIQPQEASALAAAGEDVDGMVLQPDLDALSEAVRRALDGRAFTRATLLSLPESRPVEASAAPLEDRWVALAEQQGADLILECSFRFDPRIEHETNGNFWPNIPLFLLGGPFCWFLKDRTYYADADLSGHFFSLDARRQDEGLLSSSSAQIGSAGAKFESLPMAFTERAQGNVGKYALSIVVPAGLVAKESDALARKISEEVVSKISGDFAGDVQRRRLDLIEARFVAPFFLDTQDVVVTSLADGRVRVSGRVLLERDQRVTERLDGYRLVAGAGTVTGGFGEPLPAREDAAAGRYAAYAFDAVVPRDPAAATVKVQIFASSPTDKSRTYTFAIPAGELAAK